MAKYEIDTEDAMVFALFGLAAASTVGIANVELFSYAFTDVIADVGSHGVTLATAVSAGSFGWVYYTNDPDLDKLDDEYKYAVIGTAALIVGIPLVPELHNIITQSDVFALVALGIQSAGVVAVSYLA